jgi:transposase
MAYSVDLRERVVLAVGEGESITWVARRFRVARSTVRDWQDRHRRGELTPGTPGPKGSMKLTAADEALLRQTIAEQPGITAKQLMPMLSVHVVESTVCRALRRLGLSLKRSR